MPIDIRELTAAAGSNDRLVHDIATLLYSTADAYFNFLFGSAGSAHQQLSDWCRRPSSEYYLGRSHAAFDGDSCIGIIVHIAGGDIPKLRRADILALLSFLRKSSISPPTSKGSATPTAVPSESCYIRAIAVSRQHRGRSYGAQLLAAAEEYAATFGCRDLRLDVRADNAPAIAAYGRFGFASVATWVDVTGHDMFTMRKALY